VVFAKLLRDLREDGIGLDIHADEDRDATRVCFALADHPGIFSRLSGALALVGAKMIERTLAGEIVASEAMRDKDKMKKRERAFKVPTHITFDNDGSDIYTIIEVDTRDRPGLLYDLTRTLAGANVYIASAVIATYGEQVVDTFYVKDMFGLKLYWALCATR